MYLRIFKKVFFSVLFISIQLPLWAQMQLSPYNMSWTTVISGESLIQPKRTSYGFLVLTDGKTLEAISNNGTILWERKLSGSNKNTRIKVLKSDLILSVSNNKSPEVSLINPTGLVLWTQETGFEIIEDPFEGRDGRFFLRGKDKISCFGLSGTCKWIIDTPEQANIPMCELPDGSLVTFLSKLTDGKTIGLRISPFGEVIEEITFSGIVEKSDWNDKGIYLIFSDGTAGLFSISKRTHDFPYGRAENKWVLQLKREPGLKSNSSFFSNDKNYNLPSLFVFQSGENVSVSYIDENTGTVLKNQKINDIKFSDIQVFERLESGEIFLCDSQNAKVISSEGLNTWEAKLPSGTEKEQGIYYLYSEDGNLILIKRNWTCNSWKTIQKITKRNNSTNKRDYNSWYEIKSDSFLINYATDVDRKIIGKTRLDKIKNGFYGTDEIEFYSELASMLQTYSNSLVKQTTNTREELTVFQLDTTGTNTLFYELSLFDTESALKLQKQFLLRENNPLYMNTILQSVASYGYDPDGELLKSMEALLQKNKLKNETVQLSICDAVFSVCRYMGRPAFNHKGNMIIKRLMQTSTSSKVQLKARETLKKIAEESI